MKFAIFIALLYPLTIPSHSQAPIKDGFLQVSFVRVLSPARRNSTESEYSSKATIGAHWSTARYIFPRAMQKCRTTSRAFGLAPPKERDSKLKYPERGWVHVLGTFRYREHDNDATGGSGHMGLWFAELRDIEVMGLEKLDE